MLSQHDANRSPFLGNTGGLHCREKHPFFLSMVATVCKLPDEVGSLQKEARANRWIGIEATCRNFDGGDHALDHAMFLHQYLRGFHLMSPLMIS